MASAKRRRTSSGGGQGRALSCHYQTQAREFLETLKLSKAYFEGETLETTQHDRCYCHECYPKDWPNTIENEGPTAYVVPRGWVGFALQLPPRARDENLDVFRRWTVSFHGISSPQIVESVLQSGMLAKPGDMLLKPHPRGQAGCFAQGCCVLHSTKCAGRQDGVIYTSPTINYAGLKFYACPQKFGPDLAASMAFQCVQQPGSFEEQRETMAFERPHSGKGPWPSHLKS
eukprot:COSAG02_NODE_10138_length_2013_cov_1.840648_1_plen_230_part_00